MTMLIINSLSLYSTVFIMVKFKLLGTIYMPVAIPKSTFDNACSKTAWYLSIFALIEESSFINAVIVFLKLFEHLLQTLNYLLYSFFTELRSQNEAGVCFYRPTYLSNFSLVNPLDWPFLHHQKYYILWYKSNPNSAIIHLH